jgi:hypothetical protein
MKKLQTYLLSLLIILSFTACKKDSSNGCGGTIKNYYYLSEADKAKVPYTGIDTLVFVSKTNDTAICIGQGKTTYYNVFQDPTNPDCAPREEYNEVVEYRYKSTVINKLDFIVSLKKWDYDGTMGVLKISFKDKILGTIFSYLNDKYYSNHVINGVNKSGLMFYEDTTYKTTLIYNHQEGILQFKTSDIEWNKIN